MPSKTEQSVYAPEWLADQVKDAAEQRAISVSAFYKEAARRELQRMEDYQ